MILELSPGKTILVSSDPRSDEVCIQLCANKGSLGLSLTRKEVMELRYLLAEAIYGRLP